MIPYTKTFLGFNLIFRLHGSPVYRACLPGLISVGVYYLLETYYKVGEEWDEVGYIAHPYGVGVLISSVSFLIIFRANYGYQRYWNACGDVHHMMSKWLDAASHTGVYHMQQKHYDHIKPPSFFDNHDLNKYGFRRDRERERDLFEDKHSTGPPESIRSIRATTRSIATVKNQSKSFDDGSIDSPLLGSSAISDPNYLVDAGKKDGGWGGLFNDDSSTYYNNADPRSWKKGNDRGFASTVGGRTPSLFLQELTHLASLLTAVAFSTLRSDIEGTEAPLDMYKAGSPWPETDPDKLKGKWEHFTETLLYLGGVDKSPAMRTAYNSSRPFPVLGGVSDNEIAFLQRARGASAKVNLAWHWLSEFIIREHLAGSLGNVGPPIISRIIQFLGDGMIFYNHARKTMFIPFPFPHAQISALFVFTIMFAVPVLMDEYANDLMIGCLLTFLTVTCLAGLHEVARELENPFRNVPNEIPLVTLQAMFNEALITLYAGFHPDHYWDPDEYRAYGERKLDREGNPEAEHFNVSPRNFDKPQSTKTRDHKPVNMKQLQELVSKQQEEIERLCTLVEGKKGAKGNVNGL